MYRRMQATGSSAGTAHQAHRTVRTALNDAVQRGYLAKNPALIAKPPRVEEDEVEPLNREEITRLFESALAGRNACRWIIAIALGLRQGEALGLRWQDANFAEGTIAVAVQRPRPKWKHGCGGTCSHNQPGWCPQRVNTRKETAPPKSKAGRRTIGLPEPLIVQLKMHEAEQEAEQREAADLWQDGGWLFTNEVGRPLNHRTDQSHWKKLLKAAGVRDARLHDARHTAATVLLELGVTERAAMEVMGWSNSSLAARYQHVNGHVLGRVATQVGTHLWAPATETNKEPIEGK
jgi:integrase